MTTAFSYVRFSSKPQERGDSLRRQVALAREYAAKHGLILDERSYQDLGISAFKGKNAIEGALGAFLKAVDDRLIPKDAVLLVESMDRLSRQQVDEALELFLSIIRRGITIVTLQDGQTYSRARIKEDKGISLIISITVMMRAHEESATKSARIKAAWQGKRDRGEILTSMGPAWLSLNEAKTKWSLIPEKVEIVKKVFAFAASGLGAPTIATKMNEAGVPTMGKGDNQAEYWEAGIVAAMLKNSAVIGVYTPKKAEAPPIEGYYPAILKPDVWHTVQEHINNRRQTGGRKGTNVANLFSGLIKCECGSRMRFVSGAKPHLYLRCLKAYSNAGCDALPMPYSVLEQEIIQMILGWAKLPLDSTKVEDPTVVLRGQIDDKKRQQANYIKVIEGATDVAAPTVLLSNLARLELEIADLEKQLKRVGVPTPLSQSTEAIKDLWNQHQGPTERAALVQDLRKVRREESKTHLRLAPQTRAGGEDLRDLRFRLQAECKRMLTKIVLGKSFRQEGKHEYGEFTLYGPIVDNLPFDGTPMQLPDGGWKEEYEAPKWGFGRTRRVRSPKV
jgi:DNA invertase Pin-like site-specific DNA recombinase